MALGSRLVVSSCRLVEDTVWIGLQYNFSNYIVNKSVCVVNAIKKIVTMD